MYLSLCSCVSCVMGQARVEKGGGGSQGGTLIFSYIRRHGSFLGFNFLNFNIVLGFQKNRYFLGILGSFLKVNVQNGGYFLGC